MDFGVVFSPLPGPPVGTTRSFSDWMRAAETVCTTLVRVGFRSIVFTHSINTVECNRWCPWRGSLLPLTLYGWRRRSYYSRA
jgi:hypothetical protein